MEKSLSLGESAKKGNVTETVRCGIFLKTIEQFRGLNYKINCSLIDEMTITISST